MISPYEKLANAIIIQACKDYFNPAYKKQVTNFFHSQWYEELTDINGEYLINKLEKDGMKYDKRYD